MKPMPEEAEDVRTKRYGAALVTLVVVVSLLLGCGPAASPRVAAGAASVLAEKAPQSQSAEQATEAPTQATAEEALAPATGVDHPAAETEVDHATSIERPEGWRTETHSNDVDPDYAVVFPQDEVNRLDIIIDPVDWRAMLDDMTVIYGPQGQDGDRGDWMGRRGQFPQTAPDSSDRQPPEGFDPPPDRQLPEGMSASLDERANPGGFQSPEGEATPGVDRPAAPLGERPQRGGPGGFGGIPGDTVQNPIYVPVTVAFEGNTWTYVGLRFKGNSSLRSGWSGGDLSLPMRLDFDQFEDDHPETDDQRFYGFKQVTLSNNWSDPSYLREKVTADVFREAGVPAAQTAFYEIYVDYGEGPVYFGLYTMVEVVDDTVVETQFEAGDGNVYKPSGPGATFAAGSFSEEAFDKQTNEAEADWSDILALFDALHAEIRTTDPGAWRSGLEAVFDVDRFLNWLAVNTVVQNWDTYGSMSHNYYLYHDPTTDQLVWIPWDNNMALSDGVGGWDRGGLSIDLEGVDADWPLIRFLMDDDVYRARYVAHVDAVINGVFEPAKMATTYRQLAALIEPYVTREGDAALSAFERAVEDLVAHAQARHELAADFVRNDL